MRWTSRSQVSPGTDEHRRPVIALGVLQDSGSVGALVAASRDEIAGARRAAVIALARIGLTDDAARQCAERLADPDPYVRSAAVRALIRDAPATREELAGLAEDPERVVRLELARYVASLPNRAAARLLGDPDPRIREAAAQSAGISQLPFLARTLVSDPSGDVRRAAERRRASLYALSHLNAGEAAEDGAALVNDPDPDVRFALIQTASLLLPEPQEVVRQLAVDPDGAVRGSAEIWLLRARIARRM